MNFNKVKFILIHVSVRLKKSNTKSTKKRNWIHLLYFVLERIGWKGGEDLF